MFSGSVRLQSSAKTAQDSFVCAEDAACKALRILEFFMDGTEAGLFSSSVLLLLLEFFWFLMKEKKFVPSGGPVE